MSRATRSYARHREPDPKQQRRDVVEQHASLVRRVAMRMHRTAPDVLELEDLFASGVVGLLQASDSYDPAGGRSFEVYAEFRVKGAMLDELRARDPLPRRTRHRVNLMRRAISHTRLLRGRDPTDEELARALDTGIGEIQELQQYIGQPVLVDCYDETVHVPSDLLPSDQVEKAEEKSLVKEGLSRLPDRYRNILGLVYEEGFNYRQIGEVIGVSEATVCRNHKEALRRLKEIVHHL